jgi:hypothetical protein
MAEKSTGTTARLIAEEKNRARESADEREREYVRGGKGRKDEVGGSGIYPASSPDAPGDAEIRSEGDLGHHRSVPEAFEREQGWWGSE